MSCIGCTQRYLFTYIGAGNSRRQDIARAASPGETALLPCIDIPENSTREWCSDDGHRSHNITRNGVVTSKFNDRFYLDPDGLEIKNVQTKDQGVYTCFDPQNDDRRLQVRLYVPRKSTFNGFFIVQYI